MYEQFKSYTRQERKTALEKRLRQYSMSEAMVELILSRENGIWDAVTCMNNGESKQSPREQKESINSQLIDRQAQDGDDQNAALHQRQRNNPSAARLADHEVRRAHRTIEEPQLPKLARNGDE